MIKFKLEACTKCKNSGLENYQTGFRSGMSTLINHFRNKKYLKANNMKKYPKNVHFLSN